MPKISLPCWLTLATLVTLGPGCRPTAAPGSAGQPAGASAGEVLATVNGAALTQDDLRHWLARNQQDPERALTPEMTGTALQPIIRQEVLAQKALQLGLDRDPKYQRALQELEAQLRAFRRAELTKVFLKQQLVAVAEVSDKEAKEYYEQNAEALKFRYRVQQIMVRSREQAEPVLRRLRDGAAFEEVAALAPTPAGPARKGGDRGPLRWTQLPEPWQAVVARLAPGQVSDLIEGEGHRYWIIKLVEKLPAPELSFENERAAIKSSLTARKTEKAKAQAETTLLHSARIEYAPAVTPPQAKP